MTWMIEIDSNTCIGSGMCAGTAPDHFELEQGYACALKTEIEPAEEAVDAAESCPVEAITIREKDSGTLVAPAD